MQPSLLDIYDSSQVTPPVVMLHTCMVLLGQNVSNDHENVSSFSGLRVRGVCAEISQKAKIAFVALPSFAFGPAHPWHVVPRWFTKRFMKKVLLP